MKFSDTFYLTILIVCFSLKAFSQPLYPNWKQYLPVTSVTNLKIYENKLYAVSGQGGLVIMDLATNETKLFSKYNAGIADDEISAIDLDTSGNIWLGHKGYGISKITDNQCEIYNTSNSGLINDTIKTLCIDQNGKLWIGTWRGMCSFDGENWQSFTKSNSGLPSDSVNVIVSDTYNNKWIGFKGGFVIFDEINWETHIMFPPSSYIPMIYNIAFDENETAWIDAHQYNSSLFKYDGDTIECLNWPPSLYNYIYGMSFDIAGNLWMSVFSGMDNFGIAMYDGSIFHEYDLFEMTGYIRNLCLSLSFDENDQIWVGSQYDGIITLKDGNIEKINDGIFGFQYHNSITIDNDNKIWLTTNHGLTEYNSDEWNYYSCCDSETADESLYGIAIDKNNVKWMGSQNRLITYENENWYVYDTSNSLINYGYYNIHNIVIDKNDTKWFTKKGLYKFDNENWTVYNTENSAIPKDGIECLAVDSTGIIWLGFSNFGISSFDGNQWNHYDTSIVGHQVHSPTSIYVDSVNTKWICTDEGLLSFNGESWTVYDTSNTGLPGNEIRDVIYDNNGSLWVGTDNGIGVYDGNSWMTYNSTNSSLKRNSIKSINKTGNNTLWISTDWGELSVYNEYGFLSIKELDQNIEPSIIISNIPNPFSFGTNIKFNLDNKLSGKLSIYNLMGQRVITVYEGEMQAGENNFAWDGTNSSGQYVDNGIYFCQLCSEKPLSTCKLILKR